jgi:sulfate permease, SulP family
VASGLVTGSVSLTVTVSLGVLVFAGPVPASAGNGIALVLASTVVAGVAFAARSCFRGAIAGVQDNPAVVLALIAAAIGAASPPTASDASVFATIVVTLGLATAVTGLVFFLLGRLRLGEIVRYVPYPVIGGFLAGTGWLLVVGALEVLIGGEPGAGIAELLRRDGALLRWGPVLGLAIVLLWWQRRSDSVLVLPVGLAAATGGFYAVLVATGTTPATARAEGWLLGPFPAVTWPPVPVGELSAIDWSLVLAQGGSVASLVVIATISLALSLGGIEVAVGEDMDFNRELETAGLTNLLVGFGGGAVSYPYASVTVLGHRMGAPTRAVGAVAAALVAVTLFIGLDVVTFVPVPVFGTVLMLLGFSFLADWLIDAWRSLPAADYGVVVLIVVAIATVGLLGGIAFGLLVAVVLFVVRTSRATVIKHTFTAASYSSNVERRPTQRRLLQDAGDQLLVLELQGAVFFGTAAHVIREVARLRDGLAGGFVVLDLRRVTGVDSSAAFGFGRIARSISSSGGRLVLTGLRADALRQLERGPLDLVSGKILVFPDLDHGVAWCEDRLLEDTAGDREDDDGSTGAAGLLGVSSAVLEPFLQRRTLRAGERLIERGERAPGVFFVTHGQVAILLHLADGSTTRLRVLQPGTIIGEMSFLLGIPATATVIADDVAVVAEVLTLESLARMEREVPELSLALYRRLATLTSERLAIANRTIGAALD